MVTNLGKKIFQAKNRHYLLFLHSQMHFLRIFFAEMGNIHKLIFHSKYSRVSLYSGNKFKTEAWEIDGEKIDFENGNIELWKFLINILDRFPPF